MTVNKLISNFLEDAGYKVDFSDRPQPVEKTRARKATAKLNDELYHNSKMKRNLVILMILLLLILFGIGIYLLLLHRNEPKLMGLISAGTFISLIAIIAFLHRIWTDLSRTDIMLALLGKLPAEKQVEVFIAIVNHDAKKSYDLNRHVVDKI